MRARIASFVAVLFALVACAGVKVGDRETTFTGRLPRPAHIFVRDFVTAPEELHADSAVPSYATGSHPPQTPEQMALDRQVGSELARELASEIGAMGLPGEHAAGEPAAAVNDLVIRGTLLSVVTGSEAERLAIGMGAGAAELKVAVEGYQMTATGLRRLGSGTLDTSAGRTPGAALPAVVAVATKNPIGLIVSTGVNVYGEESGKTTIHGKAQQVAKQIAAELRPRFESQGWIAPSP